MMNNVYNNVFAYENKLVFPIDISDQTFKGLMVLLFLKIIKIMCTSKILTDLCCTKQIKTKNGFVEVVYSVLVGKVC